VVGGEERGDRVLAKRRRLAVTLEVLAAPRVNE
jgi:hypothetical protein